MQVLINLHIYVEAIGMKAPNVKSVLLLLASSHTICDSSRLSIRASEQSASKCCFLVCTACDDLFVSVQVPRFRQESEGHLRGGILRTLMFSGSVQCLMQDWKKWDLPVFQKNFYKEHPKVAELSPV